MYSCLILAKPPISSPWSAPGAWPLFQVCSQPADWAWPPPPAGSGFGLGSFFSTISFQTSVPDSESQCSQAPSHCLSQDIGIVFRHHGPRWNKIQVSIIALLLEASLGNNWASQKDSGFRRTGLNNPMCRNEVKRDFRKMEKESIVFSN